MLLLKSKFKNIRENKQVKSSGLASFRHLTFLSGFNSHVKKPLFDIVFDNSCQKLKILSKT